MSPRSSGSSASMPERMVIDASVTAKWFLKDPLETDTDLADEILIAMLAEDVELHAPASSLTKCPVFWREPASLARLGLVPVGWHWSVPSNASVNSLVYPSRLPSRPKMRPENHSRWRWTTPRASTT